MNGFNMNRFGYTLRWVVSVNFRRLLLWFTGSVLAVFLGEILFQEMNNAQIAELVFAWLEQHNLK